MLNGYFLQQAMVNLPVIALVEQLSLLSLQRSLNNQILAHKAMLVLCKKEMMSIKSFGICKERMINVRKSLEK